MRIPSLAALIAAVMLVASPLLAEAQAPVNIGGPVRDFFRWQRDAASGEVRVLEIQKEMLREVPASNVPLRLDKRPLDSVPGSGQPDEAGTGGSNL